MALTSRYLFSASMDVTADREALFHEVYDTEHVPLILTVPGVISATRFVGRPLTMLLGGERKTMVVEGAPLHALYELERLEPAAEAGQGRRARQLAGAGPAPHQQPPPHVDGEALVDGGSVVRCGRWRRS
jgi:hypothetical protein